MWKPSFQAECYAFSPHGMCMGSPPHCLRPVSYTHLLGENVIDKRRRLSKILDIPYFGRIDFQEKKDKSQVSPIYIGTVSYTHLDVYKRQVGGDTTSSLTGLAISITCIGDADKDKVVYRNGALSLIHICSWHKYRRN